MISFKEIKNKYFVKQLKKVFLVITSVIGSICLIYFIMTFNSPNCGDGADYGETKIGIINDSRCVSDFIDLKKEEYFIDYYRKFVGFPGNDTLYSEYLVQLNEDDIENIKKQIIILGGGVINQKYRQELIDLKYGFSCTNDKCKNSFNAWSGYFDNKIIDTGDIYIYIKPKYKYYNDGSKKNIAHIIIVLDPKQKVLFIEEFRD